MKSVQNFMTSSVHPTIWSTDNTSDTYLSNISTGQSDRVELAEISAGYQCFLRRTDNQLGSNLTAQATPTFPISALDRVIE